MLVSTATGDQAGARPGDQALLALTQHDVPRQEAASGPVDRSVSRPPARR